MTSSLSSNGGVMYGSKAQSGKSNRRCRRSNNG
jgi:hypothetical protein